MTAERDAAVALIKVAAMVVFQSSLGVTAERDAEALEQGGFTHSSKFQSSLGVTAERDDYGELELKKSRQVSILARRDGRARPAADGHRVERAAVLVSILARRDGRARRCVATASTQDTIRFQSSLGVTAERDNGMRDDLFADMLKFQSSLGVTAERDVTRLRVSPPPMPEMVFQSSLGVTAERDGGALVCECGYEAKFQSSLGVTAERDERRTLRSKRRLSAFQSSLGVTAERDVVLDVRLAVGGRRVSILARRDGRARPGATRLRDGHS